VHARRRNTWDSLLELVSSNITTIGIIGGLSPVSTAIYYKALNNGVRERTNYEHQAKIIIVSVDGGEIWNLRKKDDWEGQGRILADAARALERAGADFVLLAGNTMHRMAHAIEAAISLPFLHLVDATARRIRAAGVTAVGLTGTSYTMTERFYVERLASHGIDTIIPEPTDVQRLDHIIYKELCWGGVKQESQAEYTRIVSDLTMNGAKGIILGCTELTLFMPVRCSVPLFDTTQIHIEDALSEAISAIPSR
jgi:aspartate racemase